jgi:hypothetical protein
MPPRPRIKFAPGKTYVYSGSEGVYSVIAGELLEGEGVTPSGGGLSFGNGSPLSLNGKDGDVYLDLTDFKVHTKNGSGWSAGSAFKGTNGTNGSAGANGKSVRFGNGAPDSGVGDNDDVYFDLTDFKLHTKSAGSWSAGSAFKGTNGSNGVKGTSLLQGSAAPSNSAGDDGDTFLDAVNHTIYKKTAGSWAEQGSGFKGATGAGVSKFSCALTTDTYISTGNTQSTATTEGSTVLGTTYAATLYLTDEMEDVGGIVTRTDTKYRKNAADTLPFDLTGSKFTINTAGRYKIDYNATFNVQAASASANSVDLTAFIDYSTDGGSTYTTMVTQTATMTTASTTAAQTTLELTKTIFLPATTTVFFKARRSTSSVNTTVAVNAVTKSEVGDDTFVVITKL